MSDGYVTVHRTSDAIQADMLGDILRQNGVEARVLGTRHGASIGVPQFLLKLRIEVPTAQEEHARELVHAYLNEPVDHRDVLRSAEGRFRAETQEGDTSGDEAPARSSMRRALLLSALVLLVVGLAIALSARRAERREGWRGGRSDPKDPASQ